MVTCILLFLSVRLTLSVLFCPCSACIEGLGRETVQGAREIIQETPDEEIMMVSFFGVSAAVIQSLFSLSACVNKV